MNDINSLFIATTVLACGGLGLYMLKSEDKENMSGALLDCGVICQPSLVVCSRV